MHRRLLLGLAAATALTRPAPAQAPWAPDRPVRLIVGFAAGGSTDITARQLGAAMAERLGQPVVIENRPGAGGNIAAEAAARATPDGHTLFLATSGTLMANRFLFRALPFDPERDFVPITPVSLVPNLIVVHPSVPAQSLAELLGFARANPGRVHYGSGGPGTTLHLAAAMLAARAGVELVHVPYRGGAPAALDLVAGKIQMIASPTMEVLAQVRAGQLRPLAVTTQGRVPLFPEIPAVAETLPGFEVVLWNALMAPAGTPPAAVARFSAVAQEALRGEALRTKLIEQGSVPMPMTQPEFAAFLRDQAPKFEEIVRVSGARLD
ncbi:MAG: tripartite tricarboxylate transporter substrate binding protein [Acetobacteraceae bacterium]|nr:tripartite tricarboxylate transporter substrate binding protein [Acetobacteraceae bacterium]